MCQDFPDFPDGLYAIFLIFHKFNMVRLPQIVARFSCLFIRLTHIMIRFPYLSSKGFIQSFTAEPNLNLIDK